MTAGFWTRVLSALAVGAMTAGMLVITSGPAFASSCPTVNQTTGAVSPPATPGVDWAGCDLKLADLAQADLSDATLSGADLSWADLEQANLQGADLANADLQWTDLDFADLSGGTLTDADLRVAYLDDANLSSADFAGANLAASSLLAASLGGADLGTATLSDVVSAQDTGTPASLPAGWEVLGGCLMGPTAQLEGADLRGVDLSGLDLADANLTGGFIDNGDLKDTNLSGATLVDETIFDSNLSGTDLARATFQRVHSGKDTGVPSALPAHWTLRYGYLLGPDANLAASNLAGLDLAGADLADANLADASLFGADLAGAGLAGASFAHADLRGADLFGAHVRDVNWMDAGCPGGAFSAHDRCVLAFRSGGFSAPRPGATVRAGARSFTVRFRLLATILGRGTPIASKLGRALAQARDVRVTLTGQGITPVVSYCSWSTAGRRYVCKVAIPRHLKTGKSSPYTLTAGENPQGRFVTAPWVYKNAPNPEQIYFSRAGR